MLGELDPSLEKGGIWVRNSHSSRGVNDDGCGESSIGALGPGISAEQGPFPVACRELPSNR